MDLGLSIHASWYLHIFDLTVPHTPSCSNRLLQPKRPKHSLPSNPPSDIPTLPQRHSAHNRIHSLRQHNILPRTPHTTALLRPPPHNLIQSIRLPQLRQSLLIDQGGLSRYGEVGESGERRVVVDVGV